MGCMMGFSNDAPESRMNASDSEDTASARFDTSARLHGVVAGANVTVRAVAQSGPLDPGLSLLELSFASVPV